MSFYTLKARGETEQIKGLDAMFCKPWKADEKLITTQLTWNYYKN